jgi:hypothetical protein
VSGEAYTKKEIDVADKITDTKIKHAKNLFIADHRPQLSYFFNYMIEKLCE